MATPNGDLPRAEVTVFTPLVAPTRYPLDAVPPITIGRAVDCTIPIKDRYLSRRHAEIVAARGVWVLKDCGSANGTWVNGDRVENERELHPGDRIRMGDSELVFQSDVPTDRVLAVDDARVLSTISIPISEIEAATGEADEKAIERFRILNALAMELIEDRPLDTLFGFILDRMAEHLQPSRVAIGLLDEGSSRFANVEVRRMNADDDRELTISRTLLGEVVDGKKALAFMDVSIDEKLSRAQSLIMQGISSIICAPLLVNDKVVGVLYVDYLLNQRTISEEDVRLIGQIARFAAIKLETTRLREDAIQKRLMDEELKTAYVIQRRLLPSAPPRVPGYSLIGVNRPCRTISGDYFDFAARPDGRIYFVIADVSGKGITAGLLMAGLQASFRIFTKSDPDPAALTKMLNLAVRESLPPGKFITLFAGRLDPASGIVEYANAGHTPPCWIRKSEVTDLKETDLLLGPFSSATYRCQRVELEAGDALVLFTDGVTEAENSAGEEFGGGMISRILAPFHGRAATEIVDAVEQAVVDHSGESLADDLTLVVIARDA